MDISYRFNMERETQLFPQWYDSASDTTRSPHDYDRLKQNHKIGFGFLETQRWTGSLEYLYNKQVVSYRRAEKSAGNGTDHYYTIGIALSYAHDTGLVLEERLSAMVNTEEYRYPYMHYDPYRRPGYSRKALSNLSVRWNAMPWLALNSLWNISYGDDGYWYGRQYFPPDTADGAAPRQVDYYAIDSKTLEHSLFLSSKIRFHGFGFVEIGGRIKDIYERVFRLSSKAYEVNQADKGYIIEPLFGAGCDDPGWLSVELTIKCRIYIKPGLDIDVPSEWDARLGVSATF